MLRSKCIYSIPMILTVLRILLTPVFILLFTKGGNYLILSFLVFTFAAFTDYFDGYFARKYGVVSKFGKFLDPLADKVLILSAFFLFYFHNIVDLWGVILIFLRDLSVTFFRMVCARKNYCMQTSRIAKKKTFFQFVVIYLIFVYVLSEHFFSDLMLNLWLKYFIDYFMCFVVFFTVITGLLYFFKNQEIFKRF